jgi:rhodanese-related sulfurtransferase
MGPLRFLVQHTAAGAAAVKAPLIAVLAATALTGCHRAPPPAATTDAGLERAAQAVARGEGLVQPQEFARWVIAGRKDFVLIDLRPAAAFDAGHIDGARNLRLPELFAPPAQAALPTDSPLILYAADAGETAASAALLQAAGRNARALAGGYEAWSREVLHPARAPAGSGADASAAAEAQAVACYFVGGPPRPAPTPESPKALKPAPFVPPLAPSGAPPPKKREGC